MEDFKSAASAIPPPRHVVRKPNSNKPLLFPVSRGAYPQWLDAWKMRGSFIRPFVQIRLPDRVVSLVSQLLLPGRLAWRAHSQMIVQIRSEMFVCHPLPSQAPLISELNIDQECLRRCLFDSRL